MIYQFVVNGPDRGQREDHALADVGTSGTTVTVSGSGFPANTDIESSSRSGRRDRLQLSGDFTTTYDVPHTPFTGIHDVMAAGGAFSDSAQFRSKGVERPDGSAEIPGRPARGELHRCRWRAR